MLQGKISNFETDLFTPLIARASELTRTRYKDGSAATDASLRIIADHSRAATFLISDGVLPVNEGRGYVLRKILRRGIRHGRVLGQEDAFMYRMVERFGDEMQGAYPELAESAGRVAKVMRAEEERFDRMLALASKQLDAAIKGFERMRGQGSYVARCNCVPSLRNVRFALDFMVDAARDQGIAFDLTGFELALSEEKARARASWKGGAKASASPAFRSLPKTIFEGYGPTQLATLRSARHRKGWRRVPQANAGESVEVVLDHTSFYADSGGQVGDTGWLYSDDHNIVIADVLGCVQPIPGRSRA